jgi:hypothetical protein
LSSNNLKAALEYYKGWETGNRELVKIHRDFRLVSPDDTINGADEFFEKCWQYSGIGLLNKQFVSEGDTVCVKYEIQMPGGKLKPFCEWVNFEDGLIKNVHVFYDRMD